MLGNWNPGLVGGGTNTIVPEQQKTFQANVSKFYSKHMWFLFGSLQQSIYSSTFQRMLTVRCPLSYTQSADLNHESKQASKTQPETLKFRTKENKLDERWEGMTGWAVGMGSEHRGCRPHGQNQREGG